MIVVAVEEILLLVAVDEVVGGVDIEDEFVGRRGERGDELVDEDRGHANEVATRDAVLEPAERGRRGEFGGAVDFGMVGGGLPEGIGAEALVVVEVFVAGGDAEQSLGQERPLRVNDALGRAGIGNGGMECLDQADLPVGFAQQQEPGVGSDVTGGKLGDEFSLVDSGKRDGCCGTLCHRGGCG